MRNVIQYGVFSGGGAKGVAYAGTHKALQETGILSSITKLTCAVEDLTSWLPKDDQRIEEYIEQRQFDPYNGNLGCFKR